MASPSPIINVDLFIPPLPCPEWADCWADALAKQSDEVRKDFLAELGDQAAEALEYLWWFWGRRSQMPPKGQWQIWFYLAGRGTGKALALDVEIPTPSGWTTMGALRVGDEIFDENGKPCRVTFATEVMHGHTVYDVVFDDGTVIAADAEHRWLTKSRALRKAERRRRAANSRANRPQCARRHRPSVVTTAEIRATLLNNGERNHSIDLAGALQLPHAELPIDPYLLGVWLGDGDSKAAVLTSADTEIPESLAASGCPIGEGKPDPRSSAVRYSMGTAPYRRDPKTGRMLANGSLHSKLNALGVFRNKHIPTQYLRASEEQRMALLQGLMDTDGSVGPSGTCEFSVTNERLARDAHELALSLGLKASFAEGRATLKGRDCGPRYRVTFTAHKPVFRLPRKLARQHTGKAQAERIRRRYIIEVRERHSVPVRCITVDSLSHLFLASRAMVPTHNTRTGAEWVIELAMRGKAKRLGIALVGATVDDARDIIIEGESGILAKSPPWFRPIWNASKRTLVWPNGEWARTYSADRPDRLRGKQHAFAWADELAAWRYEEAWDQLMLGLRLGEDPQVCITTTPRATPLVRRLAAQARASNSLVRGTTYENRQNLAPTFLSQIITKYEGTRLGRQELNGDILEDNPGALWQRKRIDDQRIQLRDLADAKGNYPGPAEICDRLGITKLVVSVDPAVTSDPDSSNETGITVVGTASREKGYLLDDVSGHYSPNGWAAKVFGVYDKWKCDAIIGEVNNGGDLIEHTLRTFKSGTSVRRDFKFDKVHASRGKRTRAEPVAALDEQFRLHHVGTFGTLEDQLTDWDPVLSKDSPDRLDAYVWGVTYLMVGKPPPARGNVPEDVALAIM